MEDDFLFIANDGKPALELADDSNSSDKNDTNKADFHNKGVVIVKDEMEERLE